MFRKLTFLTIMYNDPKKKNGYVACVTTAVPIKGRQGPPGGANGNRIGCHRKALGAVFQICRWNLATPNLLSRFKTMEQPRKREPDVPTICLVTTRKFVFCSAVPWMMMTPTEVGACQTAPDGSGGAVAHKALFREQGSGALASMTREQKTMRTRCRPDVFDWIPIC